MEIRFHQNVLLYQRLNVTVKPAFRKMSALPVKKSPEVQGDAIDFNKQKPFGAALLTASVFYGIFNPLTAAWLT